jgi:hypothetical protein
MKNLEYLSTLLPTREQSDFANLRLARKSIDFTKGLMANNPNDFIRLHMGINGANLFSYMSSE